MSHSVNPDLTTVGTTNASDRFPVLNKAYNAVFQPGCLSIGLVVPLERYATLVAPMMAKHIERAKRAEELGFSALWLRDVPFNVPTFGDVGQMFDPFTYLGFLAAQTDRIALGVASVILPLRHPAHVAKAAASADVLSNGRLLLGVASGDRPEEYPALDMSYHDRGARFRASFDYIRQVAGDFPEFENDHGKLEGRIDMLPKPTAANVPLLVTGGSQQDPHWIATHGDGWMTYPRDAAAQEREIKAYRQRSLDAGARVKPVMQSLYVDLSEDPDAPPRSIHLGFSSGAKFLRSYLSSVEDAGVNHVALNLRFNRTATDTTLERLSQDILPHFSS